MCGIFGHTIGAQKKPASQKALDRLAHRGPDQSGTWQDSAVFLGHQRLSIIDLSEKGKQPMASNGIIITVNGEIYNFKELRKELSAKYTFISQSDSEVLIHGYKEWGINKLLTKLEGMYAFALYDQDKQKLFLCRDRVGIKPLYYGKVGGEIAWASELKALETFYSKQDLRIDYTAVYDYLTHIYIPTPKTLYQDIHKLEPAHYLEIDVVSKEMVKKLYWKLSVDEAKPISLQSAAKKVRELVDKAVEEQMISDVPIGFFLSGGLDSSAVVAYASHHTKKLHTYSIGFDVAEHDETHYAKLVAKRYRTDHIRKTIGVNEVKNSFSNIKKWYDEPFADTSAFPTYLVSTLARRDSTVVLTGDGGDEVFGGYNWYKQFEKKYSRALAKSRAFVGRFRKNAYVTEQLEYYTTLMGGLTREDKKVYRQMFSIPDDYDDYWYFRKFYRTDLPLLTRLQYLDFHTYLPDDILTKVDRASMAVALECRVPLLSTPLVEFMFSLPESLRYHNNELKGLMKYAFRKDLPKQILERDKKGFSIPTGKWKSSLMKRTGSRMSEYILEELFPEVLMSEKGEQT